MLDPISRVPYCTKSKTSKLCQEPQYLPYSDNDFGMGLPILNAVYSHDHPFVGLLYLVAPISLLILNPIGFVLMEAEKNSSTKDS